MSQQHEFSISRESHLKVLLHGAKYPWSSVNGKLPCIIHAHYELIRAGFLLGTCEGKCVTVTDAIPVAHSPIFASSLEASMLIVEEYCKSVETAKGTEIVGWYFGSSRVADTEAPAPVMKIANELSSKNTHVGTCLIIIDNSKLDDESNSGIIVKTKQKDKWVSASKVSHKEESVPSEFTQCLVQKKQDHIHDFDNWFEDPTCSWRNNSIL